VSIDIEEGNLCHRRPSVRQDYALRILGGSRPSPAAKPQSPIPHRGVRNIPSSSRHYLSLDDGVGQRGLRAAHAQSPKAEIETAVEHWLERTGLTRYAKPLSASALGGMRTARFDCGAFANDPEVLLMDEPFSALDEPETAPSCNRSCCGSGDGQEDVVFINHSVDEAVTLADKIMVMTASPGRAKTVIDVALERPRRARAAQRPALRSDRLWHLGARHQSKTGRAGEGANRRRFTEIHKPRGTAFRAPRHGIILWMPR